MAKRPARGLSLGLQIDRGRVYCGEIDRDAFRLEDPSIGRLIAWNFIVYERYPLISSTVGAKPLWLGPSSARALGQWRRLERLLAPDEREELEDQYQSGTPSRGTATFWPGWLLGGAHYPPAASLALLEYVGEDGAPALGWGVVTCLGPTEMYASLYVARNKPHVPSDTILERTLPRERVERVIAQYGTPMAIFRALVSSDECTVPDADRLSETRSWSPDLVEAYFWKSQAVEITQAWNDYYNPDPAKADRAGAADRFRAELSSLLPLVHRQGRKAIFMRDLGDVFEETSALMASVRTDERIRGARDRAASLALKVPILKDDAERVADDIFRPRVTPAAAAHRLLAEWHEVSDRKVRQLIAEWKRSDPASR